MTHHSNRSNRRPAVLGPVVPLEDRVVPATAFALSNNALVPFDTTTPAAAQTPVPVTGLNAGDTLVGIDFRPQNGFLYGLGFNSGAGKVQLYTISARTGVATAIGATGTFVNAGGTAVPIAGTNFGFDFNPTVDRIRVVNDAGQNFRIDPNTGAFLDGDLGGAAGSVPGLNMDGAINGPVTGVDAAAYTNDVQNAATTTLYTLSGTSHALYIQNPPNSGTQTNTLPITLGGSALDFTGANGFDIPVGVNVTTSNAPATGKAFAALTVGGNTGLYQIEVSTGVATLVGLIGSGSAPVQGLAVRADPGSLPAVGLDATGVNLVRFNTATPGAGVTVAVTGLVGGETLVGIDWRPQTGQLFGLGVNATADTGTLYRIDPQTGAATIVGTASQVAYVNGTGTAIDLPALTAGYGFDFNPTVDLIRFTTGTGVNARINPNTGAPVDGDLGGAAGSVTGTNPDGPINTFVTGVDAIAYTNSFGQTLTGGVTTLYTLSSVSNALYIQNPPNSGTQTLPIPITLNGAALDFTAVNGFDIPAEVRSTSNAPASGRALALLTVGGTTHLYSIDLASGIAADLGTTAGLAGAGGLALGDGQLGLPALSRNLVVSGAPNGQAGVFTPNGSGQYGTTPSATLSPFAGFTGNLRAAVGDVNGDNVQDTILVTGPGTPVKFAVISGADNTTVLVPPTSPFAGSEDFTGGGFVASADIDGDGRAEIILAPDQGGGPRVTIFSLLSTGLTLRANFLGITGDPNFRGGARPAAGDVNGDGTPDVALAAGFLGGPRVAIFDGKSVLTTQGKLVNDFFAFPGSDAITLRNGAFVALGDVNGDGFADAIFGGGPGGAPRVFILSGQRLAGGDIQGAYNNPVANFFVANNSTDRGGVRVAAKDADGDNKADVAVGSGEGSPARVRVYLGKNFTSTAEPTTFQDLTIFGGGVLTAGVFVG